MSTDPIAQVPKPLLELRTDLAPVLATTALVALQHLLPSTVHLFARFVRSGFKTDNMFVIGKPYSTVTEAETDVEKLGCYVHRAPAGYFEAGKYSACYRSLVVSFWRAVISRLSCAVEQIVVLDEGGWLCREMPDEVLDRRVVAVEHTMSGIFNLPEGFRGYPVVLMAASAAKMKFESAVIADAILGRLAEDVQPILQKTIGVIGLGNVGSAMVRALATSGAKSVLGYDVDKDKAKHLRDLGGSFRSVARADLIQMSEVILGCTGKESIQQGQPLRNPRIESRRWLASCSSGDIEFGSIARQLAARQQSFRSDPFQDANGMLGDTDVTLLNGGFPINFDRKKEREPVARIQLTRELTFASVLQAAFCVGDEFSDGGVMLDPEVQRYLVEKWLEDGDARSLFPNWVAHPRQWWQRHSRGAPSEQNLSDYLQAYSSTSP